MSLPRPLIEKFVRHLADVEVELTDLQARLSAPDGATAEVTEPLRALTHKLAGTAGAYGFPLVGERAATLEGAISEGALTDVAGRVHDLREALASAVRDEGL